VGLQSLRAALGGVPGGNTWRSEVEYGRDDVSLVKPLASRQTLLCTRTHTRACTHTHFTHAHAHTHAQTRTHTHAHTHSHTQHAHQQGLVRPPRQVPQQQRAGGSKVGGLRGTQHAPHCRLDSWHQARLCSVRCMRGWWAAARDGPYVWDRTVRTRR